MLRQLRELEPSTLAPQAQSRGNSDFNWDSTIFSGDSYFKVICEDNRTALPLFPPGQVDLVITSPPYFGQREYDSPGLGNESTIGQYLENILETFEKLLGLMKPTGSIVYNMGDKFWMAVFS